MTKDLNKVNMVNDQSNLMDKKHHIRLCIAFRVTQKDTFQNVI